MLDRVALNRSLDSIIQQGNEPPTIYSLRAYVVLYNDTLKYMQSHLNESQALKELYPKFPEMVYKDFGKPSDIIRAYLFAFLTLGLFVRRWHQSVMESYPVWQKYYHYVIDRVPIINTIASELIMRIGE